MTANGKLWITLLIASVLVVSAQAAADCKQHLNFAEVRTCCKMPEPNVTGFARQCPDVNKKNQKGKMNPCAYGCIFNSTQALVGETLNMDNVRTMIATIYNGNQQFADAFVAGFAQCEPIMSKKMADVQLNKAGDLPIPPGCSPWAIGYAMCTFKHVFTNCPASAWTATQKCEDAKEYIGKCVNEDGPSKMRHGRGGFGGSARKMGR